MLGAVVMRARFGIVGCAAALLACGARSDPGFDVARGDGGRSGLDAASDGPPDGASDGVLDDASDAPPGIGLDASPDGAPDASRDAAADAPVDGAWDAPADAAPDVAFDATPTGPAVAIAVGWSTSCALIEGGTVECWGYGEDGELGNGAFADSVAPVTVPGVRDAVALGTGGYARCARLRGGDVVCWGDNAYGEIQRPPTPGRGAISMPLALPQWKSAKEIHGTWQQTCALLADASVACTGTSPAGTRGASWTIPSVVGSTAIALWTAGGCALAPDATVWCWGDDDEGQLGNDTASLDYTSTAVRVSNLVGVTAIASGDSGFTCALLADGTVSCWGADSTGQLGSGPYMCTGGNGGSCSHVPVAVSGLHDVTAIAAGASFACAVLAAGGVACWGDNGNGELGNGTTDTVFSPVAVPGLAGVTAISASGFHACALLQGGTVACWGQDSYGELGVPAPQTCAAPCSKSPVFVPL
jgi:hypothetical protein